MVVLGLLSPRASPDELGLTGADNGAPASSRCWEQSWRRKQVSVFAILTIMQEGEGGNRR